MRGGKKQPDTGLAVAGGKDALKSSPASECAPTGSLDQGSQSVIGELLRCHFDTLVKAPLPDRIARLIARLEEEG